MEDTKDLLPDIRWLLLQHTCNTVRRIDSVPQTKAQAGSSRRASGAAVSGRVTPASQYAAKVAR